MTSPGFHMRDLLGEAFDLPATAAVTKKYFVATAPRSGSTYLCMRLWQTGVFGAPWEYLNIGASWPLIRRLDPESEEQYYRFLTSRRTTENGLFGIKVFYSDLEWTCRWYPSLYKLAQPDHVIFLKRRDIDAQAVSMARALQTDSWISHQDEKTAPRYDKRLISACKRNLNRQNAQWEQFLQSEGIATTRIFYEDLVASPDATITLIEQDLGIETAGHLGRVIPLPNRQSVSDDPWLRQFKRTG